MFGGCDAHPVDFKKRWEFDAEVVVKSLFASSGPDSEKTYGDSDTRSPAFNPPNRAGMTASVQSEISVVICDASQTSGLMRIGKV